MDDIKRVQLSEIAELITKGTTPTTLGYEFQDSGVNFLKIECFDENGVFIKNKVAHISKECHEKLKRSQLKNGDILFSIAGAIGRVAIVTEEMLPANTNQALAIIRITNEEVYLPYIKLILTSPIVKDQFEKKKQGVAQLNLSLKDINEISIPLPNIEKQIELAELFGKVANVITKRNEEIKSLDELIKARFVELFGNGHDGICPTKMLGDFCKFQQGTQVPVEEQIEEPLDGYTRFLRIIDYTQAPQPPRYVSVKGREIEENSVVIVRYGATAGFVGHGYAGILANNLFEVVPDEEVMSKDFLYLALKYGTFEQEIHDKAFGAAMPALSFGMMNDISVAIPTSDTQNEFVNFVIQVDKSKVAVQKALDEVQLLFDSLMQKYFG